MTKKIENVKEKVKEKASEVRDTAREALKTAELEGRGLEYKARRMAAKAAEAVENVSRGIKEGQETKSRSVRGKMGVAAKARKKIAQDS